MVLVRRLQMAETAILSCRLARLMEESKVTLVHGKNYRGNGGNSKLGPFAGETCSFEFITLFPADEA
jgi:hypothetical protein